MKQETLEKFAGETGNNFKQTEIGLIPEDWEVVRLGEVAKVVRGVSWKKTEANKEGKGIPVLTIPNVEKGKINFEFNYFLTKSVSRQKLLNLKDIIFVASSGSIENVGRNAILKYLPFERIAFASFLSVLRAETNKIVPEFLYFLINSRWIDFTKFVKRAADGKYNFQLRDFERNALIPLPPLPEQRKIVRVLDKIQQAIEIQDRIIEQAKRLKKSLMQKLFTEGLYGEEQKETEIGLIPKSWEVVRLGEVFEVQQGKQLSRKRKIKKGEIECKFLRTSNVFWEGIKLQNLDTMFVSKKELDRLKVRKGDIFVCEGGDVGRTAILEEDIDFDLIFQNHLHRLRPKSGDIYPKFFVYWMEKHIKLDRIHVPANVTTIPNLSASRLKSFFLPLPSFEEQKQITHILSTIDRKIEVEQKRKQVLKELFKTMLHKLMSGEIRLKEVEI